MMSHAHERPVERFRKTSPSASSISKRICPPLELPFTHTPSSSGSPSTGTGSLKRSVVYSVTYSV